MAYYYSLWNLRSSQLMQVPACYLRLFLSSFFYLFKFSPHFHPILFDLIWSVISLHSISFKKNFSPIYHWSGQVLGQFSSFISFNFNFQIKFSSFLFGLLCFFCFLFHFNFFLTFCFKFLIFHDTWCSVEPVHWERERFITVK